MTAHFDADPWDYENGFWLTSPPERMGKALAQYELYKEVRDLPGDVIEVGVCKGASLARLLTYRKMLEPETARTVWGFDWFGKFPRDGIEDPDDLRAIDSFESQAGDGFSAAVIDGYLFNKGFDNYVLVEGDVRGTVPNELTRHPELRVALLHLDLDVYEPTKAVLDAMIPRLVPDAVIMVDDYGTMPGATRAIDELCEARLLTPHKLGFYRVPAYIRWRQV